MASGHEIYLRFKATLILKEQSLTSWAAEHGTGVNQVKNIIMAFAGSDRIPIHPISQHVLTAVYAEIAEVPVLSDKST
jgi:hypothetical protein